MAQTPLARDFLGRSLIQGADITDYLGRLILASTEQVGDETDYLGRLLLAPAPPA